MAVKLIEGMEIPLVPGGRYRAFARLVEPCPDVIDAAMLDSMAEALGHFGFSDAGVGIDPPQDWPPEQQTTDTSRCPVYLEMTWPLDRDAAEVPRSTFENATVHSFAVWRAEQPDTRRGVAEAAGLIREAWALETNGEAPTEAAVQVLLAISRFEGGFGTSFYRNGSPTQNNWGALHCPTDRTTPKKSELWDGCTVGVDTGPKGDYVQTFRTYANGLLGARDFLRVVRRFPGGKTDVLNAGDANRIAEGMKGYYTEPTTPAKWGTAMLAASTANAKALGVENLVHGTAAESESEDGSSGAGVAVKVGLGLLVGYGLYRVLK